MAESKKSAAKKSGTKAGGAEPPASGPLAQIFGVRHLSPMGAWHLARFIERVDPTAVLIEGPSDADDLLVHFGHKKIAPPVALLAYTKSRPVRSILYPLAAYSPEWIAATMGLRRRALVRFMDLPAATFIALHAEAREAAAREQEQAQGDGEKDAAEDAASSETRAYLDDPYQAIARISGDPDHETWWERHFEHNDQEEAYRAAIFEFGRGLREVRRDAPVRERETLVREAYMRRVIRQTIAEGHDPARIVVVCGAFHAPELTAELPAMTDAQLADLPSLACALTLMPYSYPRLSAQSGYGAGNHAPMYYQALWEEASAGRLDRLPVRYLAELAGALRRGGQIRSSAAVIEAARLAHAMAALHGETSQATLRDLRDAAATCLAYGDARALAHVCAEVEIGTAIGRVPEGVPRTSIQEDFYLALKGLRLEDYLQDKEQVVKGATGKPWLDLREDRQARSREAAFRDRHRSTFFHRLRFLGIAFAKQDKVGRSSQGTFKEAWTARWTPECEIALVENALHGETIELAATRRFEEQLATVEAVDEAAAIARRAVECDLPAAVAAARTRVQVLAVDDAGFVALARACDELARLTRYKEVRALDLRPLEPVVAQLFLRGTLLASAACRCDDDAARGRSSPVHGAPVPSDNDEEDPKGIGAALARLQDVAAYEDWAGTLLATDRWFAVLDGIADDDGANPYLAGMANALLLERGRLPDEVLDRRVARRLSPGTAPADGAAFFEGLASRNHMALLSRRALWAAMSAFVDDLDDDAFRRALVGLRRAFGSWEQGEIRRIGEMLASVWGGGAAEIARALETRVDEQELANLASELDGLDDLDL